MSATEPDERQGLEAWRVIATIPDFPLVYSETALVVIDLTVGQIARDGDRYTRIREAGMAEDAEYAYGRCDNIVVPNTRKLLDAFHQNGAPVIFTTCASLTGDGSDQTWRHRAFGHICAADSRDAQVVDELAPRDDDMLLVKTGSSAFNSTNIEHLLRNMQISTLVLTGVWTNSCVEGAARDAGDRDFKVVLAEDCCAAMSPLGHNGALEYLDRNFCHVKSADEIIQKLAADTAAASAG
jgi:nicotinamidase-related amidase